MKSPQDSSGRSIGVGDRVNWRGKIYTIKAFGETVGRYGTRVIEFKEPRHRQDEVPDEIAVDLVEAAPRTICPWCGDSCPRWGNDTCPMRPRQLLREEDPALWKANETTAGPVNNMDKLIEAFRSQAPAPSHVSVRSLGIPAYTQEQFEIDRTRLLAVIGDKHGVAESEVDTLIREHRYEHSFEDPEDRYIQIMAMARAAGWL